MAGLINPLTLFPFGVEAEAESPGKVGLINLPHTASVSWEYAYDGFLRLVKSYQFWRKCRTRTRIEPAGPTRRFALKIFKMRRSFVFIPLLNNRFFLIQIDKL